MHERPAIVIDGQRFAVIDCSELGLCYEGPATNAPEVGTVCEGTVHLRSGPQIPVSGEVVRYQDGTVALWFGRLGISFGAIIAEQWYLRNAGYVLSDPRA